MEKIKRQKVVWKCFVYDGNPDATTLTVINCVLETPAEIQFSLTGNGLFGAVAYINNDIILEDYKQTVTGTAQYPYSIILANNQDEIDTTTYRLKLTQYARLQVLCKYYVNI